MHSIENTNTNGFRNEVQLLIHIDYNQNVQSIENINLKKIFGILI